MHSSLLGHQQPYRAKKGTFRHVGPEGRICRWPVPCSILSDHWDASAFVSIAPDNTHLVFSAAFMFYPRTQSPFGRSSSIVGAIYQFRSDSGLPQRGHSLRCRRAVRTADPSWFILRCSSACRCSLDCKVWVVQALPSSSPRQISSTPLNPWRVIVRYGAFRHDVSLHS